MADVNVALLVSQTVTEAQSQSRIKMGRDYASFYEAWAVLRQRIEETKRDAKALEKLHSELWDAIKDGRAPGTYPVSLAVQFVAMGLSTQEKLDTGTLDEVLTVHQYGVAMTILNASMRIMRISHIDMQRVLYSLTRDFDAMCRTAMRTPLEQMSNYAPMTDILAASHVKAHVRLFMG